MDRSRSLASIILVVTLAVLAGAPHAVAQRARPVSRLGILTWDRCPGGDSVFGVALRDLGRTWDQSLEVICHSGERDHARLRDSAAALVAKKPDVIAALTHVTAYAAHRATQTTPIVMITSGDPVRTGLVASLARPGGNVTGLTYYSTDLVDKRLQLLREIVPSATRIAALENPNSGHVFGLYTQDAEAAATRLGLKLLKTQVTHPRDLDRSFDAAIKEGAQALLVLTDPMLSVEAPRIAELAAHHRLPAMYWAPWFVEAGGLAAYSADYDAMVRRAAHYVDRILRGARPGDLPVEQPTKFELVINIKAAAAMGLSIPESVRVRADRLIDAP